MDDIPTSWGQGDPSFMKKKRCTPRSVTSIIVVAGLQSTPAYFWGPTLGLIEEVSYDAKAPHSRDITTACHAQKWQARQYSPYTAAIVTAQEHEKARKVRSCCAVLLSLNSSMRAC